MNIRKPILAGTLESFSDVHYPVLCTPKLDGIRCLIVDGLAVSRTFKPIPNTHIRHLVSKCPEGFDGELIVKGKPFSEITGDVMRESGEPDFTYAVFDYVASREDINEAYEIRMKYLAAADAPDFVEKILPVLIETKAELLAFEEKCLSQGYEGVMMRGPYGRYKEGRSTAKEGILVKLKRFEDSEAEILECIEQMENTNTKEKDAFGRGKRSMALGGMVPKDTLGAFRVRDIKTGIEFCLGTGLDDALRAKVWENKEQYIGKLVKYKHQSSGAKEAPRFPVFLGIRNREDL